MRIFHARSLISVSILLSLCAVFTFVDIGYAKDFKPKTRTSGSTVVRHNLHVTVMGGRRPIAQSSVTVYEVGTTGKNTATPLIATSTDSSGRFNLSSFTCHNSDSQLYITAESGISTASGSLNPSIGLVAMLGPCNKLPANVVMNELTTAAASYAMAQFTNTAFAPDYGANGSPGSDLYIGVNNAASLAMKLVTTTAGGTSALLNTPPNSPAFLNTIADILVSCVNDVPPFTVCSNLRSTVSSGVGMEPDNTWGVATTIAQHPADNVGAIYAFLSQLPSGVSPPFTPTLTVAPTDLALSVLYPIPGAKAPSGLTIDHDGNVWVSDAGANTIFKVRPAGTGGFTLGGKLSGPQDVFFDSTGSGSVWISSTGNNSVLQMDTAGNLLTDTSIDPKVPQGLATDSFGQLWYANNQPGAVLQATKTGSMRLTRLVSTADLDATSYLTVDTADPSNNIIWVTNQQSNGVITVVRVVNNGTGTFTGTLTSIHIFPLPNGAGGISLNNAGDVWAANTAGAIFKLNAADGSIIVEAGGGGVSNVSMPVGVATDSFNNVWVSNNNNIAELNTNGIAVSPSTGFTAGGLFAGSQPGLAIDRSGNVWATNTMTGAIGLVELVGAASPVATPRGGRPTAP